MEVERFARIRDMLAELVLLSEDERVCKLDELCGGDHVLRKEVMAMLALENKSKEILAPVQEEIASGILEQGDSLRLEDQQIGNYKLLRVIAAGGMGTVYEALQENPRRSVALKVVNTGMVSPESIARFRYETRVLARLQHPGIALIYEAGVHRDTFGREVPFFAMEYVDGARDILRYAEDKGLDRAARLDLFLPVCEAVHHGHRLGVIHRDLKPDNLLVDRAGLVKVIDFGVARGMDTDLHVSHLRTAAGDVIGTLGYMSPEQLAGDLRRIDTRSDVYALAVVLYELICGRSPYDLAAASLPEVGRIVTEVSPLRPTSFVPEIERDLETILLKGLEKDPERRYGSVESLAQDLRHFQRREPITARPPSTSYQLRMFARRHRGLATAVGLLFMVMTGSLVVITSLYFDMSEARAAERDQKQIASREAEAAQFINQLLLDTIGSPHPLVTGPDARVADLLDQAVRRIEAETARFPELRAPLLSALGSTYDGLSLFDAAAAALEEALALFRASLSADDPHVLDCQAALISARLGQGRHGEGLAICAEYLPLARSRFGNRSEEVLRVRRSKVKLIAGSGQILEAMQLAEDLLGDAQGTDLETHCAETYSSLCMDRGDFSRAEELLTQVLAKRRAELPKDHYDLQVVITSLADCHTAQKEFESASELLDEVLAVQLEYLGENHEATLRSLISLGSLQHKRGEGELAEQNLTRALAVSRNMFDAGHSLVLAAQDELASSYQDSGKLADAEPLIRASLAKREAQLPVGHPELAINFNALGSLLYLQGNLQEAEQAFVQAMAGEPGPEGMLRLTIQVTLGEIYTSLRKLEAAEEVLDEALAAYLEIYAEDHLEVLRSKNNLARVYEYSGRVREARDLYQEVYEGESDQLGPGHPLTLGAHNNYAQTLRALGDYENAIPHFEDLILEAEASLGDEHQTSLSIRNNLALCYHSQGRFVEARAEYERALTTCERVFEASHPLTLQILSNLGHVYGSQDEPKLAAEVFGRAALGYDQLLGKGSEQAAQARKYQTSMLERLD